MDQKLSGLVFLQNGRSLFPIEISASYTDLNLGIFQIIPKMAFAFTFQEAMCYITLEVFYWPPGRKSTENEVLS